MGTREINTHSLANTAHPILAQKTESEKTNNQANKLEVHLLLVL